MPNQEINDLRDYFVQALAPEKIYLFGSYADGRENAESDIDFYIIVNDGETDMIALTARAYRAIRHRQKRAVDIIVNTESRFDDRRQNPTIEKEVFEKGVILYGA